MASEKPTPDKDRPDEKSFLITIDRTKYPWEEDEISGAQVRGLPPTPIPPNRDLFQIIPGHPDRKIKEHDLVKVYDGLRFFTAPNTINPGTRILSHHLA